VLEGRGRFPFWQISAFFPHSQWADATAHQEKEESEQMWKDCSVLITGRAFFMGSYLVDSLLKKGAVVAVGDDFSSGRLQN
jgi:hypothetical protein